MTFNPHVATRRELLLASGTLFAWAYLPKLARAEGRDPRLLVIVLRGALDGLAAVAPVGDPDWVALRGDKALTLDGQPAALPLDAFFALNPAMPNLHRLYKSGAAAIVHAAATWRAVLPNRVPPTADGSTARSSRCNRAAVPAVRAMLLRSAPLPRWLCAGRRRFSRGRRGDCPPRAMTR